jgi:DNA-binding MarR family transcriptional regulator
MPEPSTEGLLVLVGRTWYDILETSEREIGMSHARLRILAHLRDEGEVSQAGLQAHLKIDGAAVSRHVKQLAEDRLVERRADPNDNRFTLVSLTESGRSLLVGLAGRREEYYARALAGLDAADLAVLRRGLDQIRHNLRAGS